MGLHPVGCVDVQLQYLLSRNSVDGVHIWAKGRAKECSEVQKGWLSEYDLLLALRLRRHPGNSFFVPEAIQTEFNVASGLSRGP